jgi:acyl dehydratase
MNQLTEHYLEDFAVGQTFGSGRLRIDGERALAFAAEFDPQPFHLDEAAARRSIFGGLTASGWHTAAVTMRLLVETELKPAGGIVGAGLDECRWPRPVRPGDELRIECEGDRGATVKVASGAGPDQAANDHPEPGRGARAGACREPGRAAPAGHSRGVTAEGSRT